MQGQAAIEDHKDKVLIIRSLKQQMFPTKMEETSQKIIGETKKYGVNNERHLMGKENLQVGLEKQTKTMENRSSL